MGRSQREKGKRGEREAAKKFQEATGIRARRSAQATGQTGQPDLDCNAPIHCEVKVRKSIGACRYYEQAERDCLPHRVPFVLMREDRGEWFVMIKLKWLRRFLDIVRGQGYNADSDSDTSVDSPDRGDRRSCGDSGTTGCGDWSEHSRYS